MLYIYAIYFLIRFGIHKLYIPICTRKKKSNIFIKQKVNEFARIIFADRLLSTL